MTAAKRPPPWKEKKPNSLESPVGPAAGNSTAEEARRSGDEWRGWGRIDGDSAKRSKRKTRPRRRRRGGSLFPFPRCARIRTDLLGRSPCMPWQVWVAVCGACLSFSQAPIEAAVGRSNRSNQPTTRLLLLLLLLLLLPSAVDSSEAAQPLWFVCSADDRATSNIGLVQPSATGRLPTVPTRG